MYSTVLSVPHVILIPAEGGMRILIPPLGGTQNLH